MCFICSCSQSALFSALMKCEISVSAHVLFKSKVYPSTEQISRGAAACFIKATLVKYPRMHSTPNGNSHSNSEQGGLRGEIKFQFSIVLYNTSSVFCFFFENVLGHFWRCVCHPTGGEDQRSHQHFTAQS